MDCPDPGYASQGHLNENLGSIRVQLSPADLRELEMAYAGVKVHGGRMNEMQMRIVDQSV